MRSCKNFLGVSIGVISLLSLDALGQNEVTVEYSTVGCQSSRWTSIAQFDAGAAITITGIESDWTAIRIRPTTSNTTPAIGRVTLGVSTLPSNGVDVFVASIECRPSEPDVPISGNAGSTWAGLISTSGQLRSAMTFLSDENAPGVGGYPYEWNPVCEALHGPTPPAGM